MSPCTEPPIRLEGDPTPDQKFEAKMRRLGATADLIYLADVEALRTEDMIRSIERDIKVALENNGDLSMDQRAVLEEQAGRLHDALREALGQREAA